MGGATVGLLFFLSPCTLSGLGLIIKPGNKASGDLFIFNNESFMMGKRLPIQSKRVLKMLRFLGKFPRWDGWNWLLTLLVRMAVSKWELEYSQRNWRLDYRIYGNGGLRFSFDGWTLDWVGSRYWLRPSSNTINSWNRLPRCDQLHSFKSDHEILDVLCKIKKNVLILIIFFYNNYIKY